MTDTRPSRGKLYVVATPIGNLDDLSPRARDALASADVIAAEDTRRAHLLLSRIGVETPVIAYHEHNEEQKAEALVARLESESVALISDAGTPLVSDPGFKLVKAARDAGFEVVAVPGPCAAVAALTVAGLPTDRFVFEGFLPRRGGARDQRLGELRNEQRTLVLYEAVHRVEETLAALEASFGAERKGAIARELTKMHEQVRVGTLKELRAQLGAEIPLLGEFVIVVAGAEAQAAGEGEARRVYELLLAEVSPDRALKLTAAITGWSRNAIYRLMRT